MVNARLVIGELVKGGASGDRDLVNLV